MIPSKRYIGDGVYVAHDGFGIVLTTENGISTTNQIFLEPVVIAALEGWIAELKEAIKETNDGARTKDQDDPPAT